LYYIQWTIDKLATNISIHAQQYKSKVSAFPNPFHDNLTISYTLEKTSNVRVDMLDINGSLIQTLVKQNNESAGKYTQTANISAQNLPAGVYLIRYVIDDFNYTEQIIKE
jgi:5-hydroxyisourate hydrolase-like protein (transthyretin family)